MEEAKRSEKSRAERLRSNLTFRNQRKSEVVLWIFRVHFVCGGGGRGGGGCATRIYEKGIAHKGRNACPGSEEIRWLKLRLVSIFFSLSLFLFLSFPFLFSLIFLPLLSHFWQGGSALNDSKRWMEVEKERKRRSKRGGRTISKGFRKKYFRS